jgi:glycosyltransferase involved in cell wall biosynthesis
MCEISIIIPTYKPESYFHECLVSVKDQSISCQLYEILIILNGIREPYFQNIEKMIKEVFSEDNNVKLYYSEIKGVSNARNIGLDKASGKFITFIDDDDFVSRDYLLEMYNIALCGIMPLTNSRRFKNAITENMYGRTNELFTKMQSKKLNLLNVSSYFSIPYLKLIDKEIIGNRRYDTRINKGEDGLFMFLISDKIKELQFTRGNAIYYRRVRDNSLGSQNAGFVKTLLLISLFFTYYFRQPLKYNFFFLCSYIIKTIFRPLMARLRKNRKNL